jgi:phosphate transport system substrate-binding protein
MDSMADGSYPVSRPLYVYVKNAHVTVVPGMQEYLAEFTSPRAWGPEGYLEDKGLIPLPERERQEMTERANSLQPLRPAEL